MTDMTFGCGRCHEQDLETSFGLPSLQNCVFVKHLIWNLIWNLNQGAAKGGRQKEFDHFFFVFGTLSATFRSLFLTLLSLFSSLFCQTPFAGLLLVIEISDGKDLVKFLGGLFYLPGKHGKYWGEFRGKFRSKFQRNFRKLRFKFRDFLSETSFSRRAVLKLLGADVRGKGNRTQWRNSFLLKEGETFNE